MKTSLMRRLVAGATALMVGAVGAVALATPASAEDGHAETTRGISMPSLVKVQGKAECVEDEWHITWKVKNKANKLKGEITEIKLSPEDERVIDGFEVGDKLKAGEKAVGTETLDGETVGEFKLEVTLKFKFFRHHFEKSAKASVELGEDCAPDDDPGEELPEDLGGWVFDCDTLTITIENPFEDALTFTFVPSTGDAQDLTVGGGESGTVEFPASEGLNIDVFFEDEQVELVEPIEITSEAWAALGCDDDGEGGELPVTGASTALMAAGALALLALGGGMFMLARRRRVTFTA